MPARSPTLRTPPGRYGARRSPRALYAVGGVLLVALIALTVYLVRAAGTPEVTYGVRAFTTAERSVRITFDVRKPPDATAVCVLRARDRQGAEVGRREVAVRPRADGMRTVVLVETLQTSRRPVTGEVNSCRRTG
jgi:hypothetical protein